MITMANSDPACCTLLLFTQSYKARIAQVYELFRPIGSSYFLFGNQFDVKGESALVAHAVIKPSQR